MKNTLLSLALAVSGLFGAATAQAAPALSFTPSATAINVGDSVTVDVSISGLGSEILSAFDINFVWSGGVLGTATADFTPACAALGGAANAYCDQDVSSAGNLGLFYFSYLLDDEVAALQSDSFLLGTLTFAGLADGATRLTLGADADFDRNLLGRDFQTLDVAIGGVCIAVGTGSCVNAVPEPATYLLLASGLAGLLVRRRSKAAAITR